MANSAPAVQFSRNPSGYVQGLQTSIATAPIKFTKSNTLAVIGDSITRSWIYIQAASTIQKPSGYLFWAQALSKQRLTVVNDSSASSAWVSTGGSPVPPLNVQIDSAIASGASYLLAMGGINDLLNSTPVATIQAAWTQIIDKAIAAGMTIFWCTCLPLSTAYGAYNATVQGRLLQLNDWIRNQAASKYARQGVILVDFYSIAVEPTNASGSMRIGDSSDGLHPRNNGAYWLGKELARVISQNVPEAPKLLSSAADVKSFSALSTNVQPNGLFTTSASGLGTGCTTAVTGGATVTPTVVARSDGFGSNQVLNMTAAAAGETVTLYTPSVSGSLAVGNTYLVTGEISVTSPVNLMGVSILFEVSGSGSPGYITSTWGVWDVPTDTNLPEGFTAQFQLSPLKADATQLTTINYSRLTIISRFTGAGSATVNLGRLSIRQIAE